MSFSSAWVRGSLMINKGPRKFRGPSISMQIYTIIHHTATSRDNTSFQAILKDHKKRYGRLYYADYIEPNSYFPVHNTLNYRGPDIRSYDVCLSGNFDLEKPTAYQLQMLDKVIKRRGNPILYHGEAHQKGLQATKSACPGLNLIQHVNELREGSVVDEPNEMITRKYIEKFYVIAGKGLGEKKALRWWPGKTWEHLIDEAYDDLKADVNIINKQQK